MGTMILVLVGLLCLAYLINLGLIMLIRLMRTIIRVFSYLLLLVSFLFVLQLGWKLGHPSPTQEMALESSYSLEERDVAPPRLLSEALQEEDCNLKEEPATDQFLDVKNLRILGGKTPQSILFTNEIHCGNDIQGLTEEVLIELEAALSLSSISTMPIIYSMDCIGRADAQLLVPLKKTKIHLCKQSSWLSWTSWIYLGLLILSFVIGCHRHRWLPSSSGPSPPQSEVVKQTTVFQKIKRLVSLADLDQALSLLEQQLGEANDQLLNEIYLLTFRLNDVEMAEQQGIIEWEEVSRKRNQIARSILKLTDRVKRFQHDHQVLI